MLDDTSSPSPQQIAIGSTTTQKAHRVFGSPVPANPPIADVSLAPGNQPALLPQWAEVTPFVMATPWQFRLPGPPALTSEQYTRDFDEVRCLGGKTSTDRSAVQAEIARY